MFCFFFFKQKTAYELRISDWSSDVCSSDLLASPPPLSRLLHAHIPFHQAPYLPLSVPARDHPIDKFVMLLLGFAVLLGPETDDREQILDLAEHPPFDDVADFLIGSPGWIAAVIARTHPQCKLHHLVPEVLRISNPGGLFELGGFRMDYYPF